MLLVVDRLDRAVVLDVECILVVVVLLWFDAAPFMSVRPSNRAPTNVGPTPRHSNIGQY